MNWDIFNAGLSTGQPQTYDGQNSGSNNQLSSKKRYRSSTDHDLSEAFGLHAVTLGVAKSSEKALNQNPSKLTEPINKVRSYVNKVQSVDKSVQDGTTRAFSSDKQTLSSGKMPDGLPLGNQQVKFSDLMNDSSKFSQTVKGNTENFKLSDIHPGTYLKNSTQSDVNSVKNLFNPNNDSIGSSVVKSAGVGFAGYDILSHTADTYKAAKAQGMGDGAALVQSADTMGKYTVRDGTTWESATVGGAIGSALMPVAIGVCPIGAVVGGALASVVAQKGFNNLFGTGDKDPAQKVKAKEKSSGQSSSQ